MCFIYYIMQKAELFSISANFENNTTILMLEHYCVVTYYHKLHIVDFIYIEISTKKMLVTATNHEKMVKMFANLFPLKSMSLFVSNKNLIR